MRTMFRFRSWLRETIGSCSRTRRTIVPQVELLEDRVLLTCTFGARASGATVLVGDYHTEALSGPLGAGGCGTPVPVKTPPIYCPECGEDEINSFAAHGSGAGFLGRLRYAAH